MFESLEKSNNHDILKENLESTHSDNVYEHILLAKINLRYMYHIFKCEVLRRVVRN